MRGAATVRAEALTPKSPSRERLSPEPEIPAPTAPYKMARLGIGFLRTPLHETPAGRLAQWIARVVDVESPVHFDEVILRVRKAAGVGRAGSRIRAHMRLGATVGARRKLYRIDKRDFLWRPEQEVADVRRRDGDIPSSLRDPSRIASEEIETALVHAVGVELRHQARRRGGGGHPPLRLQEVRDKDRRTLPAGIGRACGRGHDPARGISAAGAGRCQGRMNSTSAGKRETERSSPLNCSMP